MQNKTDQFVGFDPTQNQGSGCCGSLYWDFNTQTWKQIPVKAPSGSDCSQVQAQLDQANETIADLLAKLNSAEQRVRELQAELDNQPTVCEIFAQHLDPVRRLNGEIIYYGIKNPPDCTDLNISENTGLGDDVITNIVETVEDKP